FDGAAAVIFQPAEEGGAGGKAMVDDGMIDRFRIREIYGMHNSPSLPLGAFAIRPGPFYAATDTFTIAVIGRGGHAARPHATVDPTLIASHLVRRCNRSYRATPILWVRSSSRSPASAPRPTPITSS